MARSEARPISPCTSCAAPASPACLARASVPPRTSASPTPPRACFWRRAWRASSGRWPRFASAPHATDKKGDGRQAVAFFGLACPSRLLPDVVHEGPLGLLRRRLGAARCRLDTARRGFRPLGGVLGPGRRLLVLVRAPSTNHRHEHQACYTGTDRP